MKLRDEECDKVYTTPKQILQEVTTFYLHFKNGKVVTIALQKRRRVANVENKRKRVHYKYGVREALFTKFD